MSASSGLALAGVREQEPAYLATGITVLFGARLTAWLIALIVVIVDVRPEPNLRHEPLLLALSLLQIFAGLSYVPVVRPLIRRWSGAALRGRQDLLLLSAVDLTGALALVYYSGGIGTPYYHVAVVAPTMPTRVGSAIAAS